MRDEGVFVPLHNVEMRTNRRTLCRTSVSEHFPSGKLESADEMCCGDETRTRATASAQCMKALKNMRAVLLFIYTSSSDREGLVQHHACGLPKLVAFQVRKRECTGPPF